MNLKSNLKAAAYAAQGRFCCTNRAAIRQRQQDKSQEKARSRSTAKAKTNTVFPRRNGVRRSAEIAAFLLFSNIKIRRAKKFSRGLLKKYFS
ncbi:hypothetical protein [Pseudomonas mandelii]|uniref:hypothetical protein n=1 Tax=Pseudomonas mandelii TaxID=75612 RepID=UPI0012DD954C|nr:hypothetical protein [Pseudomonas mandelii]